jgi:hypothetical protein
VPNRGKSQALMANPPDLPLPLQVPIISGRSNLGSGDFGLPRFAPQ